MLRTAEAAHGVSPLAYTYLPQFCPFYLKTDVTRKQFLFLLFIFHVFDTE